MSIQNNPLSSSPSSLYSGQQNDNAWQTARDVTPGQSSNSISWGKPGGTATADLGGDSANAQNSNSGADTLQTLMKMLMEMMSLLATLNQNAQGGGSGGKGADSGSGAAPLTNASAQPGSSPADSAASGSASPAADGSAAASAPAVTDGSTAASTNSAPAITNGSAPASTDSTPASTNSAPASTNSAPAVTDGTAATSAPAAGAISSTSASKTQPAGSLNVEDFGAVGDGKTDNTQALNAAMQAAKADGKSVYIPEGTFNHSGVINADGVKVEGAGTGTDLHATDANNAAIKLTGDGGSIANLKTTVSASDRSSQPDAAAILLQGTNNASVSNVMTVGAGSNGIRLDGAANSTISGNAVTGSNADGIAMMNGSTNNHITNNVIDQAGDDAISSDSYLGDKVQNSGNVVENNAIQNNRYGRSGVSMGGANDVFRNNYVQNAAEHSVMKGGTDSNSDTMAGSGSVFDGNHVNDGTYPDLNTLLGWNPGKFADASSYSSYTPGTGAGANNTSGNRS